MKRKEDGISLLIDNTAIHRIGHVLDQKPGAILRPVDGLVLFHFAEHIMFSSKVVISNFESLSTFDTTSQIIASLENSGFTTFNEDRPMLFIESFTEESYDDACTKAAWRVLDELSTFDAKTLKNLGKAADDTTRPRNIPPAPLDDWLTIKPSPDHFLSLINELRAKRAEGSFALMLLRCSPLRERLNSLLIKDRKDRSLQTAALNALMRVHVNEELAKKKDAVYSPAPQRARVVSGANDLFRHQLELFIQSLVKERYNAPASQALRSMMAIDRLPLPLFAFHELQGVNTKTPYAFLEAARIARDKPEVAYIRSWLTQWERIYSSENPAERSKALAELNNRKRELSDYLSDQSVNLFSSLHLGGTIEVDPMKGNTKWVPPLPNLEQIGNELMRRYDKKRIYLAALTNDLIADKSLGARILEQVGHGVAN